MSETPRQDAIPQAQTRDAQKEGSTMNTHVDDRGDVACEHGTAMDVHCCNCHSGFLFDAENCHCGFDVLCENCRKGLHYGEAEVCWTDDDVPLCSECMASLIQESSGV